MLAPSGDQYEIRHAGYRAVVTESGGALRVLEHEGRPVLDGFGTDEMASGGRGQLLMPWPNRLEDGSYTFGGRDHQLALTEPARRNASHGLARWVAWTLEEHTPSSVSLVYRLMSQTGYPWTLDLHVLYTLTADGLTVTQTATNMSDEPAPYACGAHPYLVAGSAPADDWELTLPAATRSLTDPERKLPVSREAVDGTDYDYRVARPIRGTVLDHAFTDLARDDDGLARVHLHEPESGAGLTLWVDEAYGYLMVFTGDPLPDVNRRSLAVEPMTCPPNAFRTGEGVTVLEPGASTSATWGLVPS